ncbi:lipopolysaccharide biosynthesis protein [Citrobacter amalonaticus]|uniref:Lipopolysaccharide core biosynthesis protein n=1 Tax=Citrobacter amalonaticus TaxID=35703 RepID=A0AAW9M7S6_CITAM|nr:lipopolysaccharide biosynthesis protein [Citrobacter amalonaticus]MDV2140295.1 lipopolysaccharide biosynthesis protein [Citrobacter amalonaticus]MEB0587801.1 lipopolysaccharide biosynthesis protein [Citrobacter amalonaticus]SAY83960.1 lipopolysaccharide core biosynthesis protein [Citrobacter amalonaticus]SAZ16489.1 lipopolysaccharide core biosynthesis protein [Citrobacter amalonaticus]
MTVYFINWKADYELNMIGYLQKHYQVANISVPSRYVWVAKKIRKLDINTNWLGKQFIKTYLQGLESHDIAVFNDSVITKGITPQIITNLKCHKVLLLRNSVNESFIEKHADSFDFIYDFERKDIKVQKVKHLEQFFPVGLHEVTQYISDERRNEKSVCYFLGKDKNRLKLLTELASSLMSYNVTLDFNVVGDDNSKYDSSYIINKPLSFNENLKRSLASDVLIDITREDQTGWTLRILEALYFNKKVITNNKSILNSDIYVKERFFILGYHVWDQFESFLDAPVEPVTHDILYKYSPDCMLETIINEFKNNEYQ